MADEQIPNGARRIVEDRRNPRTCVTANVIVRGEKKYFQVAHLNLFFEYIDYATIGEQIKEPSDIWQPSIIPAPNPTINPTTSPTIKDHRKFSEKTATSQ